MLYSEKLKSFQAAHPCETITVCGAQCRYILNGENIGRTFVFLNGGMSTLEMWMDYVEGLSGDCRVLLFDYPQELRTNQELVAGMYAFFQKCLKYANLLRHKFVKTVYPYISVFIKFGVVFNTFGKIKKVVLAVGTATFFDVRKIFIQYV